jgi:hypothetical protein
MSKEEVSTCFLADIGRFFAISWAYKFAYPIRKNDAKTILNKFVCKGLNAILYNYGLFFWSVKLTFFLSK